MGESLLNLAPNRFEAWPPLKSKYGHFAYEDRRKIARATKPVAAIVLAKSA